MKNGLLLLPLLITSTIANADALLPSDDSVYYSDKRIRYTAKLGEVETAEQRIQRLKIEREREKRLAELKKRQEERQQQELAEQAKQQRKERIAQAEQRKLSMPLRELSETVEISFRNKSLPSSIRSVTPPGWVVDLQIDKSLLNTQVSFSGETTYLQALKDILEPQGLTFLAYRNMKPKPLIVITHGGK